MSGLVDGMEVFLLLGERIQATVPVGEEEQVHLGARALKVPMRHQGKIPQRVVGSAAWKRFGLERSDLWVAAEILEWVR